MCPCCPIVTAATEESSFQKCHETLYKLVVGFERTLKLANSMEDRYRAAGLHYHSTQLAARHDSGMHPPYLVDLKQLFELTRAEDYKAIFTPLNTLISALEDLKSTHLRFNGTVEVLYHRVFQVLKPRFDDLDGKLQPLCKELDDCFERAHVLYDISRLLLESDEQGRRIAWQDFCISGTEHAVWPLRMGEEYETFVKWVESLPETEKMVKLGRTVEEVAFEMMCNEPEGFEGDLIGARNDEGSSL
jgi:hypothetical protein